MIILENLRIEFYKIFTSEGIMFVLCIIFTSAIMYHTDLLHSHPEMTDCLGWAATAGDHLRLLLSFSHFNF